VCGINDPGHTCDEYLVLLAKSGMTIFVIARWFWQLCALHHFDKLVDNIIIYCGVWVVEVETHRPGLSGRPAPVYPSPEGSPDGPISR
jgi:hypothetical protein